MKRLKLKMILKSPISPGLPLGRKVLRKKETKDQVLEKVIDLIAEKAAVGTEEIVIEIIRIGADQNMMIEVGIIFSMMIGPYQVIIDLIGKHVLIFVIKTNLYLSNFLTNVVFN